MNYLLWLLIFLTGCQQDEIVFITFHKKSLASNTASPPTSIQEIKKEQEVKLGDKKCSSGCLKGEECVDGTCTKKAFRNSKEAFNDLLKKGESVGFIPGITHTDYGGKDRFSPEEY